MTYQALQIEKDDAGYRCTLKTLDDSALPEGDVTVQVDYSTINYKDGLAITGKSPVVRKFPLTPGIDLSGTVTESQHPLFKAGDRVVLNGWGVGESHSGGLAQKARLKGDWLVKLPAAFTPRQAMAIGTAGYTAMLCVMALEKHGVTPGSGDILVTGAGEGIGRAIGKGFAADIVAEELVEQGATGALVNVGGDWVFDEFAKGGGISTLGTGSDGSASRPASLPPGEERNRILDLFRN